MKINLTESGDVIMKTYKSISYAYPTSKRAEKLGHGKTGCYFIELIHKSVNSWSNEAAPGCEGFLTFADSDLQNLFDEFDFPIYPASKKYHPEYYSSQLKNKGVKIMETNELKPMRILWGRLKGSEEWQEDILSTVPENFDRVKIAAAKDGYGHFRESIDHGDAPNFKKTVGQL